MTQRLNADELVIAIGTGDNWCQAGTVTELITHGRNHHDRPHPVEASPVELDFFDQTGRPLCPILGLDHQLVGFGRFGDADPEAVETRLRKVIDLGLAYLAAHADKFPSLTLPALPEPGDLPALAEWIHKAATERPGGHVAGWFHNVMHALLG